MPYNLKMGIVMRHLSAVKKLLLINFIMLLSFQVFVGFKDLDDYLIIFVFALFLNDLYFKLTKPDSVLHQEMKIKRVWMSLFLCLIISIPLMFELFHVRGVTQLFISKLCFILWAQVFLLDSFLHYRETHSKRWLVFTNLAGIFVLFFSIAI
jgi:hypothetical protein